MLLTCSLPLAHAPSSQQVVGEDPQHYDNNDGDPEAEEDIPQPSHSGTVLICSHRGSKPKAEIAPTNLQRDVQDEGIVVAT